MIDSNSLQPACHVRINTAALRLNYAILKQKANGSKVLALLKANAYGHGLISAAKALPEADAFGVARIDEAIRLREAEIPNRIVILGGVQDAEEWRVVDRLNLDVVIHQNQQLQACQDFCNGLDQDQKCGFNIWLKFDTGMHRLGFSLNSLTKVKKAVNDLRSHFSEVPVIMSHFANADDINDPLNQSQTASYKSIVNNFTDKNTGGDKNNDYEFSLLNSGAMLSHNSDSITETQLDWVRPGIALFGIAPYALKTAVDYRLKPVMSLESRLIAVKTVNKGEGVGYGQKWIAENSTRIGIASIGYGDGYPWHAENGTPVMVTGKRCQLVGRVSMDLIAIDLSNAPQADLGSTVQLWGEQLPVEVVAAHSQTIPYTLVCGITQRVKVDLI